MKKISQILLVLGIVSGLNTAIAGDNRNSISSGDSKIAASVKGCVLDKISGEALTGVAIKINDNNETVYTDFEGNFVIDNLYPGQYELSVSYISYKNIDQIVKIEGLSNSTLKLEIEPLVK